jgi:hypothetical protein
MRWEPAGKLPGPFTEGPKVSAKCDGTRRRAVVAHGNVDLPDVGIGGRTAHADAPQPAVFDRIGHAQEAQIAQPQLARFAFGQLAGADEDHLAGAASALRLNLAREGQRLVQVQGGGAGVRIGDGFFQFPAVGFEGGGGSGEGVGAHQHDAIAQAGTART